MAIARSKLSDLLGPCSSPDEMLSRLREEDLLSATASEDDILRVIQDGLKETADEITKLGFTWATAETRIASKLAHGGYLSEKGRSWHESGSILRRFARRFARK